MAAQAHADITVTTTADIDTTKNTSVCSLRDAIILVNSGDPTKQYGGCLGTDTNGTVIVQRNATLLINSELPNIKKNITIQSAGFGDTNDPLGAFNPKIVANGKFRIISNTTDPVNAAIKLTFTNVDLQGCGTGAVGSPICATNGGVIFNTGILTLTNIRISNGSATNGGAIYNTGPGVVNASSVEIKNNNAEQQGAALFTQNATFNFNQSLLRENSINTANASSGFVIYPQVQNQDLTGAQYGIHDSTIYNNSANAIRVIPGIIVGNVTIVGNHGGVTLDSNNSQYAGLFNTIIGDNNGADCTFVANDKSALSNLVYTNSCGSGQGGVPQGSQQITDTGNETLMATGTAVSNGRVVCALSPAVGMLCPFTTSPVQFNGYLLPRLLFPQYKTLSESPIVNKGFSGSASMGNCTATDQRGKDRSGLCDIGAIELVIPSGNIQTNGQDIGFGQTASLDLTQVIGDGQLIPAAQCPTVYQGAINPPQGGPWLDGCLVYTLLPNKGQVTSVDAASNLMLYTPSSDYHGYDQFSYNISSTTSVFSTAKNDQTINVTTTIVQSQPAGMTSKTVGAGGVGIFAIVTLMGLALRRRLTGGQQ
jgi:rhombotarget A family protien